MNWPPMLLHLRFPAGKDSWGLWLPFFLLYPILLALMLLVSPLVLLIALVSWPTGQGRRLLLSGIYIWAVLFQLRGLRIDIKQHHHNILINFI